MVLMPPSENFISIGFSWIWVSHGLNTISSSFPWFYSDMRQTRSLLTRNFLLRARRRDTDVQCRLSALMIYFLSESYLPFVHISLIITAAWYLVVNVFKVFLLRMLAVTCEFFTLTVHICMSITCS